MLQAGCIISKGSTINHAVRLKTHAKLHSSCPAGQGTVFHPILVMLKLRGVLFACGMCGGPTEPWNASTVKSSLKAVEKKDNPPISLVGAKSDSRQVSLKEGRMLDWL